MKITGFIYTDCINLIDCPKCGAEKGQSCFIPSGRRKHSPHIERIKLLQKHELWSSIKDKSQIGSLNRNLP